MGSFYFLGQEKKKVIFLFEKIQWDWGNLKLGFCLPILDFLKGGGGGGGEKT